jgi:hypothetical protein
MFRFPWTWLLGRIDDLTNIRTRLSVVALDTTQCIIGWETNGNYDRRMTFSKTSIAVHVHFARSLMTSCWFEVMERILLSFLVQT